LERLNLKENSFVQINNDIFLELPNLTQILISSNKIEKLDKNLFLKQNKLQRLFLRQNLLTEIDLNFFSHLKYLICIDLESNSISKLQSFQFTDLIHLESIDLLKNKIAHLEANTFSGLHKLRSIGLDKNLITKIDSKAFTNLPNLQIIKLDFNLITCIEPDVFSDLNSILELNCNTLLISNVKIIQKNIIDKNREKFLQSIDFICQIYDNDYLNIINSFEAYQMLEYVSMLSNRHKHDLYKSINIETQKNLTFIISNCLQQLYSDINLHLKNYKPFVNIPKALSLSYIHLFISIIANWSNFSIDFNINFVQNYGIKMLFLYLNSTQILDALNTSVITGSKYLNSILLNIYTNILSSIFNLVIIEDFIIDLEEAYAFDSLVRLSFNLQDNSNIQIKIYMIIANLLNEKNIKDVEQLEHIKKVCLYMCQYAGICANKIADASNCERCPMIYCLNKNQEIINNKNDYEISQVAVIEVNESFFYLVDILFVLYKFSLNDEIKYDIYATYSMQEYLKTIIMNGNDTEKEHSLYCLLQLCFDQRVASILKQDIEFVNYISNMNSVLTNNNNIKKNSQSIMWLLEPEKKNKISNNILDKKQIMISYNSKSREICLEIKKYLEHDGYNVWIDVESMFGSSLESMATAIDNSFCILVCATEKYKESNNCRLEAEYIIQQKKNFIPLILEKNWKFSGWLAMMFGTRLFVDFSKQEFSKAYKELKRLLDKSRNKNDLIDDIKSNLNFDTNTKIIETKRKQEIDWDEKTVCEWMKRENISDRIKVNIKQLNGQMLFQLYNMLKYNPEFFYGALKNDYDLSGWTGLKDLAHFCTKLTDLFEDK
jgi:hypothetical protein